MNKCLAKRIASSAMVMLLAISWTSSAFAFEKMGGRLTQTPYNLYYYNGATTYSSQTGMNHYQAFQDAMISWNNTPNTKIELIRTTDRIQSVVDLLSETLPQSTLFGVTRPYLGQTELTVDQRKTTNWSWATCSTNFIANWDLVPSKSEDAVYLIKGRKLQATSAHEIGHAFGLAHVGEDPWDWANYNAFLMYSSPVRTYMKHNIYGPMNDDVLGVQSIYGKLY